MGRRDGENAAPTVIGTAKPSVNAHPITTAEHRDLAGPIEHGRQHRARDGERERDREHGHVRPRGKSRARARQGVTDPRVTGDGDPGRPQRFRGRARQRDSRRRPAGGIPGPGRGGVGSVRHPARAARVRTRATGCWQRCRRRSSAAADGPPTGSGRSRPRPGPRREAGKIGQEDQAGGQGGRSGGRLSRSGLEFLHQRRQPVCALQQVAGRRGHLLGARGLLFGRRGDFLARSRRARWPTGSPRESVCPSCSTIA